MKTLLVCVSSAGTPMQRLCARAERHADATPTPPAPFATTQLKLDEAHALVADLHHAPQSAADVFYALYQTRKPALALHWAGEPMPAAIDGLVHPLLTVAEYTDLDDAEAAVDAFLAPPEQPGRIFVIDGGDGAGKQTQTAALIARLRTEGYPVATMDFPHDAAMHGKLIRTLLSGTMGGIKSVNPLLFASLYAQNRYDVTPTLNHWLARGINVVLDRYVEANFGHQASKLPADERPALIDQLSRFEHEWLGVPRAHRVTYLNLPPSEAARALSADGTRAALDMHETAGDDYKLAVRDTFLWCSENFEHWRRLDCLASDGSRLSREALGELLYDSLKDEFVNRGQWPS